MAEIVQGAQVVSRVSAVLRVVSEHAGPGATTGEIARGARLTRPTAHRLLTSLAAEGFVDHDPIRSRWHLGPELYLLGTLAADRYDISDIARDSVRALARDTGESAFLSARRGSETVCLLREEGSFPVRSFVLYEGVRFPLGVASAGLAILSFMKPSAIDDYLDGARLDEHLGEQYTRVAMLQRIAETRRAGYSLNPGLVLEGSWGMGAAVFDSAGSPAWALSLTGIEGRFKPERQRELGDLLLLHAHAVTQKLHAR